MNSENKRESTLSASKWLFLICWLVYSCAYIARVNYSTAIDGMKVMGVIDENIAGLISSVYFVVYALGQVFNGIVADKKSPFVMVIIGLSIVALSNVAMFLVYSPSWLLVLWWALNGLGQSMLWSPVFFIISNALAPKIRFMAVTIIALCTPAGKISGYLFSGLSLNAGGWKGVFVMASSIILFAMLLWIAFWLSLRKNIVMDRSGKEKAEKTLTDKKEGRAVALFVASGMLIVAPSLIIHGLFLNGASEWIPTILQSSYGLSDDIAAYVTMIIPAVGAFGVFLCNFVYMRFKKNEMATASFFMIISILPVIVLYFLTASEGQALGMTAEAVIFTAMYGLLYVLQLGYSHCIISLVPMRFSVFTLAATVTGINNAINYMGSAISTYGMSVAIARMKLTEIMTLWFILLVIASVFVTFAVRPWKKFKEKNNIV